MMDRLPGSVGLIAIFLFVIYWDFTQHSLSGAFWNGLQTFWKYPIIIGWTCLTLHLFKLVPYEYDLVWRFGNLLNRLLS